MTSDGLCLCRDQPAECLCKRRDAEQRRQKINEGMAFGIDRAPRSVPAAPVPYPVGYGENESTGV